MYKCPKCGSKDLWVEVIASARLVQQNGDEFLDEVGDADWDDDSCMNCASMDCTYSAPARYFLETEGPNS